MPQPLSPFTASGLAFLHIRALSKRLILFSFLGRLTNLVNVSRLETSCTLVPITGEPRIKDTYPLPERCAVMIVDWGMIDEDIFFTLYMFIGHC